MKRTKLPVVEYAAETVDPDKQTHFAKGPVCEGCALAPRERIAGKSTVAGTVDIMLVSESPSWASASEKQHFYGKGGRVIREAWKKLVAADERTGGELGFKQLKRFDTYAVQCQSEPDDIDKNVLDRCAHYLRAAINHRKPKVVLTFGAKALKATGIKAEGKFDEVRGKILHITATDHEGNQFPVIVIPTFSTRALLKTSGLYNLLFGDMLRAMRIATGKDEARTHTDIGELSKDYVIPKTVAEVQALCDEIVNYAVKNATPQTSTISVDTETNTLHPHKKDSKVLCISFAWDAGKSCAIPLWHKDATWSPAEFEEVLAAVRRVLESPKPKVFHNAKFDLKFLERRYNFRVNNVAWCSLLGEHLLREDQSGSYSLKILGRSYFPEFANYADKIHELASVLSEEEQHIEDMLDGWKKPSKKKQPKGCDPDAFGAVYNKSELSNYLKGPKKKERKKKRESVNYEKVPMDQLLVYAAIDTDLTRRLLRNQWLRMKEEDFVESGRGLMRSHSIPASRTLGGMEYRGMRVDRPYLDFLDKALGELVEQKAREINRHWKSDWGEFNPNSTKDLGKILYVEGVLLDPNKARIYNPDNDPKLGEHNVALRLIPGIVEQNEKSQQWKTDKKTLRAIVEHTKAKGQACAFTVSLLDYRAAHKGKSGFCADIRLLSELDGRLHTNFNIHGTATGRLSSSEMNLQNWPKWIANYNFKKLLIPDDPDSEVIVNLDYKGAEVKIFAAYSRDEKLIEALNNGLDAHCFFLEKVYGIPYAEAMAANDGVHPDQKGRGEELKALRTIIKRVVFGTLYGAGPKKIAETAGVPMQKAQEVIEALFTMFPAIRTYVEDTKMKIRKQAYLETFFGRRRRFPLHSVSSFFRSQADRRGVNMLIQSTSSDIVLGQLCELDDHIDEIGGKLGLTVHDSMVAVVPKKNVEQLPEFLTRYCVDRVTEKYPWLPVQFNCDIEVGPSYGECVPIKHYIEAGKTAADLVAMSPEERDGRLKAMKENNKNQYKAVMLRMGDAEKAFREATDQNKRLEEQFDEEAMDELRDFEDANKEREAAATKKVEAA